MSRRVFLAALAAAVLAAGPVLAGTVRFTVIGIDCAACAPPIVKALKGVSGVSGREGRLEGGDRHGRSAGRVRSNQAERRGRGDRL